MTLNGFQLLVLGFQLRGYFAVLAAFEFYECVVILDECIDLLVLGHFLVLKDFSNKAFEAPLCESEALVKDSVLSGIILSDIERFSKH